MAREIRAVESGFYETLVPDEGSGPPTFGKPLREGVIPAGLEEFHAYIRFTGDPGLYRLTVLIEGDVPEGDVTLDWGEHHIAIPVSGDGHAVMPLPSKLYAGTYVIKVFRDKKPLIEIPFTMMDKD